MVPLGVLRDLHQIGELIASWMITLPAARALAAVSVWLLDTH